MEKIQISIEIKAPELSNALLALAQVLSKPGFTQPSEAEPKESLASPQIAQPEAAPAQSVITQLQAPNQQPAPQYTAPVSQQGYGQAPQHQAPIQQPVPVQQPVQPQSQQTPPPATVPTETVTYTLDQLAVAGTSLVEAGRMQDLRNLLAKYGVQALTQLPKEQYGAIATELRALGAKL